MEGASSSRSTSPDPLTFSTLPSATRPGRTARHSALKSTTPRPRDAATPARSIVMDTGRSGDGSPWRIKVTVQAEPKDGSSPMKQQTRTMMVPLRGGSSSPGKRSSPTKNARTPGSTDAVRRVVKNPQRKRKGTPIARNVRASVDMTSEAGEEGDVMEPSRPSSSPSTAAARSNSSARPTKNGTERTRRLGKARADLEHAIEDAVGYSDAMTEGGTTFAPGDITLANEDFTMVSVETLQTMKNNTSMIEDSQAAGVDKSALTVSYLPSSPPQTDRGLESDEVQYPDLSTQANEVRDTEVAEPMYDAMSWKPTGPAETIPLSTPIQGEKSWIEPSEWQREREAVSKAIDNANSSQVIVIRDETEAAADQNADNDIWAEEASRSLEDDMQATRASGASQVKAAHAKAPSPHGHSLFSHLPLKPPRSKIPRTWRRSSGADFAYSDSPDHNTSVAKQTSSVLSQDRAPRENERVNPSNDEGRRSRSSGVLTPPSTDDDVRGVVRPGLSTMDKNAKRTGETSERHQDNRLRGTETSDLSSEQDADSAHSDSPYSKDGDDTGLFWQNNLPNVYRRGTRDSQRQPAIDISDLLAMTKSSSPKTSHTRSSESSANEQQGRQASQTSNVKQPAPKVVQKARVMESPLRKSLLKSSKIGGGLLAGTPMHFPTRSSKGGESAYRNDFSSFVDQSQLEEFDSFQSKASDQRQLLSELKATGVDNVHQVVGQSTDHQEQLLDEIYDQSHLDQEELYYDEPMRSYEEHLNLDSPRRIQVNFNDSVGNSSLLFPKREYPPLFDDVSALKEVTRKLLRPSTQSEKESVEEADPPNLLSRLGSTFWSALMRPTGPTFVMPTETPEPEFPVSLRVKLRSRYGVLADTHPWTMAHMRILHRMLNSLLTNTRWTDIPQDGSLPPYLTSLIGAHLPSAMKGFEFTFDKAHAQVVSAFMQILVPAHVVQAMEAGEVEPLGDGLSKQVRGTFGWTHGPDPMSVDRKNLTLPVKDGDPITVSFVARAIGNALFADEWARARQQADLDDLEMTLE